MKINTGFFQKKKRMAVSWSPSHLDLLIFDSSGIQRYASFFLQESSRDGLSAQIEEFKRGVQVGETLLILPRSEVLQKEMVLTAALPAPDLRKELESKLTQLLPYSPGEMAYGLQLEEEKGSSKGLLYAITSRKLEEVLSFICGVGIEVDEIAAEDQVLGWEGLRESPGEMTVRIDQNSERILLAAVRSGQVVLSRSISKNQESFGGAGQEVSLALLELDQKPRKFILTGNWDSAEMEDLQKRLPLPAEKLPGIFSEGLQIPAVISGARFFRKYPFASLLPAALKIKKWHARQKNQLREAGAAFGIFLVMSFMLASAHTHFLKSRNRALESKVQRLIENVRGVRETARSLEGLRRAAHSKQKIIGFLSGLAEQVPGAVRLKEIQIEENEFVFRGESPSQIFLTQTVQVFESNPEISAVKLEHTRLRKRLSQEFFEFEVSGKWN